MRHLNEAFIWRFFPLKHCRELVNNSVGRIILKRGIFRFKCPYSDVGSWKRRRKKRSIQITVLTQQLYVKEQMECRAWMKFYTTEYIRHMMMNEIHQQRTSLLLFVYVYTVLLQVSVLRYYVCMNLCYASLSICTCRYVHTYMYNASLSGWMYCTVNYTQKQC